jgi:hypothetical protein
MLQILLNPTLQSRIYGIIYTILKKVSPIKNTKKHGVSEKNKLRVGYNAVCSQVCPCAIKSEYKLYP